MLEEEEKQQEAFTLKLGDIIEISAATNEQLNEHTFFIEYIDEAIMTMIDVASMDQIQLNRDESTGVFTDESITEIRVISRSESRGYARQNDLLPGTWVEIHIHADISIIITGEITNLEEDQIEIRTFPELDVIYIDFEYKGIPRTIPIKKIIIRDKPSGLKGKLAVDEEGEAAEASDIVDPEVDYLETGEMVIKAQEDAEEEEAFLDSLRLQVAKSKEVVFGEDLETIMQYVELPESQKRYGIDLQTTSLLDELLSTLPASQRNSATLRKIHVLIARYRELRRNFSVFDDNGDVRNMKRNNPNLHKPIVEHIRKLDAKMDWIIPVVSVKKKVYTMEDREGDADDGPIDADIVSRDFGEVLLEEEQIKRDTYYNERSVADESKYFKLYQQLEDLMRPFENPVANPQFLASAEVRASMEAIVDNLDEFSSSVMHISQSENIVKRRYVIQKYDLGLNRRLMQKRGDYEVMETLPMTGPDTMYIKSLVLLPAPAMNYSRVHLPTTSILEKANLHFYPLMLYRILKKNRDIAPFIIDDLEKELYGGEDKDKDEDGEAADFLADIRHYVLSDNVRGIDPAEKFEKFLQAVIPKTRILIGLVRKYIKQKLSFVAVVQALEPFKIYSEDISYKQYLKIRRFIMDQISEKKEDMEKKRKEYGFLPNFTFPIKPDVLSIIQYLLERPELLDRLLLGYRLPEREILQAKMTTGEILNAVIKIDNGVLLCKLISQLMASLMTPTSLASLFSPAAEGTEEERVAISDCNRRVLTKRYSSIDELQKDNGGDIFYDKEYDDTPYHIMDKYKDQKKAMLPDKFRRFLIENLIQKHDSPKEYAEDLASWLILGKKPVKDGEYALLVIKPHLEGDKDRVLTLAEKRKIEDEANIRAKKSYYYRKNGTWIVYNDIDEEAFTDTSALFCNLKEQCISTDTPLGGVCDSSENAAKRMREIAKKKIRNEFDSRYELSYEEMQETIQSQLGDHLRYLQSRMRLESIKLEGANNIAYQIGLEAAAYSDAVISPRVGLRDSILGQSDFVKKQHDIVKLYGRFCREPLLDLLSEDAGWKYCKESNAKLLPAFLYDLALCFVSGGDYKMKLEEMCHTHGLLSDSGNAIVDKSSGLVLRAIDFAEEDGYDAAGFKLTTHAFIEKGELDKAVDQLLTVYSKKGDRQICESEETQMICNLLDGIARQIGHPLTNVRDYTVRIASTLCDSLIDSQEKYEREAKKLEEKKGIKLPPYKKRKNQLTILITAAAFFTAIQTETPSLNTKKTMPGCVKSFRGFPLNGEEDTTGIQYLACVLHKMEKKIEPWNSIDKMTQAMMTEQIKKILITAMKHAEVDERYLKKREYLIANDEEVIPEEHALDKWLQFLPPLISTNATQGLHNVSADFKDELISMMKKGHKKQHDAIMTLRSKRANFSQAIVESVQSVVEKKDMLLSSMTKPFLQNVCCNERDREHIPLYYFAAEMPDIDQYTKAAGSLSRMSAYIGEISKPAILYDPRDTRLKYPPMPTEISERDIYAAFIHYCELDKDIGVPAKFHAFFTDIPVGYNNRGSLDEKMDFLKRHDKRFDHKQLNELMRIVNRENRVDLYESPKYNISEILKDIIILFDDYKSPVIDQTLRENLYRVLVKYDKTKLMTIIEESDGSALSEPEKQKIAAIKVLKNGLAEIMEETFKPNIIGFLKKYGKMGARDLGRLTDFFDHFVKTWATRDLYKVANFVKNSVDEMTRVFPNILITNTKNTTRVHSYWGLAPVDSIRIFRSIEAYYEPLGEFREDPVLQKLLLFIYQKFVDIRLFFENLPIHESIQIGSREYFSLFDKDTIEMLLEYVFLSVLHEYIIAADDEGLVRLDQIEKKRAARAAIARESENDDIESEYVDLEEEYEGVYGDMAEIEINAGNQEELKSRVAKLLLAFINIMRKNKAEIDISYDNIAAAIRKRKEKEKNRIVEKFKSMSEDERKVEDMKKKYKMDEWNVGTQKGIFQYDKKTSEREVMEQEAEEELDIQKHGIRKSDFVDIHGDTEEEPLREMVDLAQLLEGVDEGVDEENMATGMAGLKSNFMDGQFYSDDESDDGFGDE